MAEQRSQSIGKPNTRVCPVCNTVHDLPLCSLSSHTENASARWQTPPEIWNPINREFQFDLDAAADETTFRVRPYLTDALSSIPWPGERVWLNPPYGRLIEPFVRRAADEARLKTVVVALIPFRCRASWWHDAVIGRAREVRCIRKRVRFVRLDGSRGDFTGSCDSCLVVWDKIQCRNTRLTAFEQEPLTDEGKNRG